MKICSKSDTKKGAPRRTLVNKVKWGLVRISSLVFCWIGTVYTRDAADGHQVCLMLEFDNFHIWSGVFFFDLFVLHNCIWLEVNYFFR